MLARFRSDPLIGNVLGLIALFVALGAGAYAAGLAPDSVKSKHIVDGQVRTDDVANDTGPHALTGSDIASESLGSTDIGNDALGGSDIQESTLGKVPDAGTLDGKNSSDFVAPGSEDWTSLDLYVAADLCHYANYGGGYSPAGYYRDPTGVVHLRGLVHAIEGASYACGTQAADRLPLNTPLPPGYRPANKEVFTISSNNKPARIDVVADGHLELATTVNYPAWADAKQWFSLDGISYRCAPSGQNGCP